MLYMMVTFVGDALLLSEQAVVIVELVKGELLEFTGSDDGEAVVGDVTIKFWMCKNEGA